MKTKYSVALAMAGGFTLGAIAVQGLHAQATPFAYLIAEVDVRNERGYTKEFLPLVVKTQDDAGAKYVVRGGKTMSLEGAQPAKRVVVLQFETVAKAQNWWNAKATRDAFVVGRKYAKFREFIAEGATQ